MNDNIYLDVYIKVLSIVIIISFHKNWRIVNKIIDLQRYTMKKAFLVSPGDRVAQLILIPVKQLPLIVVDEFDTSERGGKGFGSSGIN